MNLAKQRFYCKEIVSSAVVWKVTLAKLCVCCAWDLASVTLALLWVYVQDSEPGTINERCERFSIDFSVFRNWMDASVGF